MATNPNSMVQEAVDAAISARGEIGLQGCQLRFGVSQPPAVVSGLTAGPLSLRIAHRIVVGIRRGGRGGRLRRTICRVAVILALP